MLTEEQIARIRGNLNQPKDITQQPNFLQKAVLFFQKYPTPVDYLKEKISPMIEQEKAKSTGQRILGGIVKTTTGPILSQLPLMKTLATKGVSAYIQELKNKVKTQFGMGELSEQNKKIMEQANILKQEALKYPEGSKEQKDLARQVVKLILEANEERISQLLITAGSMSGGLISKVKPNLLIQEGGVAQTAKQAIAEQDKTLRNSLIDAHAQIRKKMVDAPNPDIYNQMDETLAKIDDTVKGLDTGKVSQKERLAANEFLAQQKAALENTQTKSTQEMMNAEKTKSITENQQTQKTINTESLKQDIASGDLNLEPEIKGKERMSATTLANSPNVSTDMAKRLRENPNSRYQVRHRTTDAPNADVKIFNNIVEAERIARTETTPEAQAITSRLVEHFDKVAQQAKARGDMAGFQTAMDHGIDIATDNWIKRTEAGQFIEAGKSINELSPEGVIRMINKIVKKVGGQDVNFSAEEYNNIIRAAEDIQNTIDPKQRALKSFQLLDDIYSKIPTSLKTKVYETLNIPRAIMATADFSAGFRQLIFYAPKHPVKFTKAFLGQFKYAFSEKAYQNLKADIVTDPDYHLMVKYKLPLSDIQHGLATKEERFMSTWAEKIPGVGHIVRMSDRAYTGLLNKVRVDYFKDFLRQGEKLGITDEKFFRDAAEYVGSATGRGGLGKLEKAAVALNSTFFSPRLMASRLKLLNPVYYAKLNPVVRKEALKSLFAFAGAVTATLGLAKMAGAEVGTDMNSADFGKIKIGKTRIDIMGGFQQYIRMASQIITGKYISTTTGKELTLGEGFNTPTRWDILIRQLEAKEAPVASLFTALMKGTDYQGKPINIPKEIGNRFVPMVVQDIIDLAKKDPKLIPLGVLGSVGFGLQTYNSPDWKDATASEKYQILKDLPASQANRKIDELRRVDKQTYTAVKKYLTWDKYNLSPKERGFTTLEIKDGTRPKAIYDYLMKEKSPAKRKTIYDRLVSAGIITSEVKQEILKLKK